MRWLVVIEHEVKRVSGGGQKDDLEDSVPGGVCERPEEIYKGMSACTSGIIGTETYPSTV